MSRISLLTFSLIGLTCLVCAGQDLAKTSLQFLTFPESSKLVSLQMALGENQFLDCKVPCNDLSPAQKVPMMQKWIFGETIVGEDGKPQFKVYGEAPALSAANQIILLIRKGDNVSDGVEVIPLASDGAQFGGGKFLFMNTTKVDIAGEVGEKKFVIQPGKFAIIQPTPGEDGRLFHASFFYRHNDNAEHFFSSTWPYNKDAKSLIFFYHDTATKQLAMHTIQDF